MAAKRSTRASGRSKTILPDYPVSEWQGLNTYIKDLKQLSDGQSPDSLNWITGRYKDHIELRRGYQLLGKTRNLGTGRVSGLQVGTRSDARQVPFFSYGQKLLYYNASTDDAVEIGTNTLPAAASGDDISLMPYKNIAGSFMYATSPNSSMYKIVVADPNTAIDLGPTDYQGHGKTSTNRMFLWNRNDLQGQKYSGVVYNSVPDATTLSTYPSLTGQNIGTGDGTTRSFSGTLPGIVAKTTVFNTEFAGPINAGASISAITQATQATVTAPGNGLAIGDAVYIVGAGGMTQINNILTKVVFVSGSLVTLDVNSTGFGAYTSGGTIFKTEYFVDDLNGNLASNLGGTGAINYATGAYALSFNTAPTIGNSIFAQYSYEGVTNSITDFVSNGAASYTQFDGGGDIVNIYSFDQVEYCLHLLTSWYLNISASPASNLPYRNRLGTPFLRAGFATEDGVVYLDNSIPSHPRVMILSIENATATAVVTVVPDSVSDQLDLSSFGFSKAAIFRWNEYDILACAPSQNGVIQANNASLFVRNIYSGQWDYCDIPASCFDEFTGILLAGDSFSNNVFKLFSGLDDDGANIANYWQGKLFNLGVDGLKKFNRFVIKGLIQQTQSIQIGFSFDSGNFVNLATVLGTGSYVNIGNPVLVGSSTVGSHVVGGGGDVLTAYPFEVEFLVSGDQFEYVQPQFQAVGIGYVQIDEFIFKDIRYKSRRIPPSRTNNPD